MTQYNLSAAGVPTPYPGFNGQVQQALRPFPQYGFIATDCCLQNVGHSSYDALIATLERRFSTGLNLQASYTWSKSLTDADSILPGINGGVSQEQNPFDHRSSKSISIQDIPNTFVISYIYELPFGRNKRFLSGNRAMDLLVGGWQVGAVQRYQSGEPFSFGCAGGIPGWDNCISFSRVPGSRIKSNVQHLDPFTINDAGPDPSRNSIFNGLKRTDDTAYSALQPAPAFFDQNAGPNRGSGPFSFGNVPRVTGEDRNFRYFNEDISVIKNLHLTEKYNFSVKAEFLNAFNRHVFAVPSLNPYDKFFGVPQNTINTPRNIQLTGRFTF